MSSTLPPRTMWRLGIAILLVAGFAPAPFLAAQSTKDTAGKPEKRRALLVGINDYPADKFPNLRGAVNDVERMRSVLIDRCAFAAGDIELLTDSHATRKAILMKLRALVATSEPQDWIYFHYSGHGSQVEDLSGDETEDHLDETLVPHDGRTPGIPDIVDDELDMIFSKAKTEHVIIVLDSCHSGTGTRGSIQTRGGPADRRLSLYGNVAVAERGVRPIAERYVFFSGADHNQPALDGPVAGKVYGFFTHSWCHALTHGSPNDDPRQVLERVVLEYRRLQESLGLYRIPEPQLESNLERLQRPLFALRRSGEAGVGVTTNEPARLEWKTALPTVPADTWTVLGARGRGVERGAIWGIYGPRETRFAPGRALITGRVVGIDGDNLRLRLLRPTPSTATHDATKPSLRYAPLPDRGRAVALLSGPADHTLAIAVAGDASESRVRGALSGFDLSFVRPERADYQVHQAGDDIRIIGGDGNDLLHLRGGNFATELPQVMARSMTTADLLSLDHLATALELDVDVARRGDLQPIRSGDRSVKLVGRSRPVLHRVRRADEPRSTNNSLVLRIRVSADAYVTIVDVDPAGDVHLLFPNPVQEPGFLPDGFVRGDAPVLIPDGIADDNRAGFWFDYAEPVGSDTIRVFATSELETAEQIRAQIRQIAPATASRGVAKSERRAESPLAGLRAELERLTTRGIVLVSNRPRTTPTGSDATGGELEPASSAGDWTAATLTVDVRY